MEIVKTKIKKGHLQQNRRDFLKKAGGFAVMGMFGLSFFTSCSSEEEPTPTNNQNPNSPDGSSGSSGIEINGSTITIDLSIITELNSNGGWLLIEEAQTLVVNDGSIKALTSICTHSGCDRNWSLDNGNFVCSCHNSTFTTNGEVISGPASSDLEQFSVSTDNDTVTISK